ncbi:hypothetical protein HPB51_018623 [Rhipicephalus microplus]|uniref:Uncharacterized protein n=1 Tax=Rhipicephalus microplus TaxID=6941 RepID=A0A9J6F7P5_RHIMP|nr:hypothetical protein HPB51_018623 [Rhipicephalus microplus]
MISCRDLRMTANSFGDENPFDSSQHRYRPLVLVLLLPVYLCPMLLQDSQGWKTVFCIALTLSLLLSDEFPSMAAAFLPLVLAPLLGLADAQTLVPHYMDGTVLSLACAQCLVGVLASDSNIVARISCALFGMLGLRYLGMGFVAASLLAGSLLPASHPVLLLAVRLVERVVGDLEADALDAQRRGDGWFDYSHAAPRTTRALSTDDLFDQLASTVVSLPAKKASTSRRKFGRFHRRWPDACLQPRLEHRGRPVPQLGLSLPGMIAPGVNNLLAGLDGDTCSVVARRRSSSRFALGPPVRGSAPKQTGSHHNPRSLLQSDCLDPPGISSAPICFFFPLPHERRHPVPHAFSSSFHR